MERIKMQVQIKVVRPITSAANDHFLNTLSLFLIEYHNPIAAHRGTPIGKMKKPITKNPMSIIKPIIVNT